MTPVRGLAALVAVAIAAISCTSFAPSVAGSGRAVTQQRDVQDFSDVRVGTAVKATIIVGPEATVTVTADDNVLDSVKTDVFAGRLTVSVNGNVTPLTPIEVQITTPSLDGVEVDSAANVIATGVNATEFRASADLAASLTVRGDADTVDVTAESAATADLGDLPAQSASVDVSSAARVTVNAQISVTGSVDSAGVVTVEGSPASLNVTSDSGGTVVRD